MWFFCFYSSESFSVLWHRDSTDWYNVGAGTASCFSTGNCGRGSDSFIRCFLGLHLHTYCVMRSSWEPYELCRCILLSFCMGLLRQCGKSLVEVKSESSFPNNILNTLMIILLSSVVKSYTTLPLFLQLAVRHLWGIFHSTYCVSALRIQWWFPLSTLGFAI